MTTIAKLTKQQDGGFLGTLSGIGIEPKKIHLQPVNSDNAKAPNYLVILDDMEIGAAFDRENKRGEYTLVVLDSPALAGPIFSYLRKEREGRIHARMGTLTAARIRKTRTNRSTAPALRRGRIFSEGDSHAHRPN